GQHLHDRGRQRHVSGRYRLRHQANRGPDSRVYREQDRDPGSQMKVLILSQDDVRRLLTMRECVDLMAETLATLARGEAVQPLRTMMRVPDAGIRGMMPAYVTPGKALGIKVLTVFHAN